MLSCENCQREYITENDFLLKTSSWKVCAEGNLWLRCQCLAQLKISRGEFTWYTPEKLMSDESASIFNTLSQKGRLPHISTSIMELQLQLADENSSAASIVKAIKTDPAIAAEILSVASTMKLGAQTKITSLEHAVTFIGRNAIMDLSMIASLKTFQFNCQHFNQDRFWASMRMTGILAEALARKYATEIAPDLAYLTGSLCNIGKAVGAICLPGETDRVHDLASNPKSCLTWYEAEKKLNIPDHQLLGEIACVLWGFPEEVSLTARHHHDYSYLEKSKKLDLVAITALANQLCHWIESEPDKIDQKILDRSGELAGMHDTELEAFVNEVKETIRDL